MKQTLRFVAFFLLSALWAPLAMCQIISTSLPTPGTGGGKAPVSAHFMFSPVGSWAYKEIYSFADDTDPLFVEEVLGTVEGSPNAMILLAGEVGIPMGVGPWALTLGGWYNNIPEADYDFDGLYTNSTLPDYVPLTAKVPISLSMLEGHAGLFYRSFGIQLGLVRFQAKSEGDWKDVVLDGAPQGSLSNALPIDQSATDWTCYGVYKAARERWGLSAGLGAYGKAGIEDPPLRLTESKTVASGFLTGTFKIGSRFSVDASYWYIGSTDELTGSGITTNREPDDAQSRLVVGVGYSL